MLAGARDHGDDDRRMGEALGLESDLVLGRIGIALAEDLADQRRGLRLGLAREDDEAPGHELAMVGHPRRNGQEFGKLALIRAGRGQKLRRNRAAELEQGERVGHERSRQERMAGRTPLAAAPELRFCHDEDKRACSFSRARTMTARRMFQTEEFKFGGRRAARSCAVALLAALVALPALAQTQAPAPPATAPALASSSSRAGSSRWRWQPISGGRAGGGSPPSLTGTSRKRERRE